MAYGIFTDKDYRPSNTEINNIIGSKISLWEELALFLKENYPVKEDIKFMYGRKYGWAIRYRIKEKLLTALYPLENGFTVQIILSTDAIKKALIIKPGKNVLQTIENAKPYPEGRWLFITVKSKKDIRDIQQMLKLRAETIF